MSLEKFKNLENVSVNLEAEINGQKVKDTFCKNWNAAKIGLNEVLVIVRNPIVKMIVSIVIAVGDGIQSKICIDPKNNI